jgi:integrase
MIQLQLLSGCRPGEVVLMQACDLDTTGDIWIYSPDRHKAAWRGHRRFIYLGKQSQAIVKEFLTTDLGAYLFSPCAAVAEQRERNSGNRKTPLSCGNRRGTNRKRKPQKQPGQRYTPESYARAILRGCDIAFPPPNELAKRNDETVKAWKARLTEKQRAELKAWRDSHRWSPNQLRHTTATEIRKKYGVEGAQVVLGHSRADITQVYAERNQKLAFDIMRSCG